MFVLLSVFVCASAVNTGQVMTGQPLEVPVNNTEVLAAARFAVVEFNRANAEDQLAYKIVNITSAKIQVVAGINYILEALLGRTVCKKSVKAASEPCDLHSDSKCTMLRERQNRQDQETKEDMRQRSQMNVEKNLPSDGVLMK
ncbi:cystatin-like isoform X2 [Trachinotus anak]|uniref:cystatin-like isoform X2 n=1 Tax=Trachinotus anak TaxID=443729 RepID=UPI0039F2387E